MGGPNGEGYWQACKKKELEMLIAVMDDWEEVQGASCRKSIPGTWEFQR
jgi:hypothetical protein